MLYLVEVFNVIYLGPDEIKPEKQLGTILVDDGYICQYLYKVDGEDLNRPSIQPGDELILTNPNEDSISGVEPFKIDIDLFGGDYKESICYESFPSSLHNQPMEKRIVSKDGTGEIILLYTFFDNAMEAHLEIQLLTNDESAAANVRGVVVASTSVFRRPAFSSMLFLKKPGFGISVGHEDQIPLSRSVIPVQFESMLFLDFHLLSGDDEIVVGSLEFHAKPGSELKKRLPGKKGVIVASVTWIGDW